MTTNAIQILALVVLCLGLLGCDQTDECTVRQAVVADIDETLTTANMEWLTCFQDPTHDPAMRPDADLLMQRYADLGYAIFYVTARGEELALPDDRLAREATEDWILDHGFPFEAEERLHLAEGVGVHGEGAITFKVGVIRQLQAQGWEVAYAYGNADSDIEAFLEAGIPSDRIFLVGRLAGTMEVLPLPDDEAYTQHLADHMPSVPTAACD